MDYAPKPELYPSLAPGTIIVLSDMTQLASFEDAIAPIVDPTFDKSLWEGRTSLKEMLRPKIDNKPFNGRCVDVTFTVLANPYDRLQDYPDRGFRLQGTSGKKRESESGKASIDHYLGFLVAVNLISSGRGNIGSSVAEVFYAPVFRNLNRSVSQQYSGNNQTANGDVKIIVSTAKKNSFSKAHSNGKAIVRFATHPLYSKLPLLEADLLAPRIELEVLREQLRNPITDSLS